ncbi:conserved hypothetical protein [Aeropyrum pernix]|uniref:VIT family protein n=1 Tax=Aeropyrum pernix TaxID=56636 RepID=A0A401H8V4_AERPX|nr:conserved hypothetical protein [Aeropyrum pernix]
MNVYPDTPSIARRMFVTNGFDGLLAAIGVNIGGFSGGADPVVMVLSIMGGSLSMGVLSGVVGVYLSERAERLKELSRLEKKVSRSLRRSIYWKAANIIPLYIALWSGVGVIAFPLISVLPYIAAAYGMLAIEEAFAASLAIALALAGGLGLYLGVVSGESKLYSMLRGLMLAVGAIILVHIFKFAVAGPLPG